jgi:hypothetical protein
MTLFAVIVALGLGVMAGYLIKPIGGPTDTQTKIVSTEAGPTGVTPLPRGGGMVGCSKPNGSPAARR